MIVKNILEACDCLIVLSEMWKSFFYSIAPKSRISIVQNAVNLPNLNNDQKEDNIVRITFLGGLVRRKGILELINVGRKILMEDNHIELFIGGFSSRDEPDIVDNLNKMANESKIKNKLSFKMNITDREKDELYRTTDIFVLQSTNEGLPFGLLEAMSYSIPVITTPVGGIPELINDLENGFLISPGDEKALYEKINVLVSDPPLRKRMGQNNRLKIEENYSSESTVKNLRSVYETILS